MLKLLIADDEYFIRQRLIRMLDYAALGYELLPEAENGQEALDLILSYKPDVAILDIKMPLKSGLELAEEIYRQKLPTKVIILTSYDYFSYAQESIRYGVFSYLLKPVDRSSLASVLSEIQKVILQEQDERQIIDQYQQRQQEELVLSCLSKETCNAKTMENLEHFLEDKGLLSCLMALFRFENTEGSTDILEKVRLFIDKNPPFQTCFFFGLSDNSFGLLFNNVSPARLLIKLKNLKTALAEHFHLAFNGMYSQDITLFSKLPDLYEDLSKALSHTMFLPKGELYLLSSYPPSLICQKRFPCGFRNELLIALNAKDAEKTQELIHEQFTCLCKSFPSVYNLSVLLSELFLTASLFLKDVRSGQNDQITFYLHHLMENLLSIQDIEDWCMLYFQRFLTSSHTPTPAQSLALKVQEMIQNHYKEPSLDLSWICNATGYTASYLSTSFKKATGVSVIQYITKYRMEAAARLLWESDMKISQVCQEIGYTDTFYFSKRFKNYFGCSPSEYGKKEDMTP